MTPLPWMPRLPVSLVERQLEAMMKEAVDHVRTK